MQWKTVTDIFQKYKDQMIARANKGRKQHSFAVGDHVLVSHRHHYRDQLEPPGKLRPKASGPFEILEQVGTNVFRLKLPARVERNARMHNAFHAHDLIPYVLRLPTGNEALDEADDANEGPDDDAADDQDLPPPDPGNEDTTPSEDPFGSVAPPAPSQFPSQPHLSLTSLGIQDASSAHQLPADIPLPQPSSTHSRRHLRVKSKPFPIVDLKQRSTLMPSMLQIPPSITLPQLLRESIVQVNRSDSAQSIANTGERLTFGPTGGSPQGAEQTYDNPAKDSRQYEATAAANTGPQDTAAKWGERTRN